MRVCVPLNGYVNVISVWKLFQWLKCYRYKCSNINIRNHRIINHHNDQSSQFYKSKTSTITLEKNWQLSETNTWCRYIKSTGVYSPTAVVTSHNYGTRLLYDVYKWGLAYHHLCTIVIGPNKVYAMCRRRIDIDCHSFVSHIIIAFVEWNYVTRSKS